MGRGSRFLTAVRRALVVGTPSWLSGSRYRRARELERAKSDFLRLASHELRSPLAILRGYVSLLEDGSLGELPPAARRVVPVLKAKLQVMTVLVEEMLETARLEDDRLQLHLGRLDLAQVVRETVREKARLATADHPLQVRALEPVQVTGDRERIATIVGNLIENAVKYSPEGGAVQVTVEARADEAQVRVRDQGIGIAAEDLPKLFHRFGRLETEENEYIPGTGLGLYLAQELAHRHGGGVTVSSKPGQGSTFTLSLPLSA